MSDFHSEWVTIGQHRILISCRASFPNAHHRFVAEVAATTCSARSETARVVRLFYDDKACCQIIDIATDNEEDQFLAERITDVLQTIFDDGSYLAQVQVVEPGNEDSDHYHRTEHLSVSAGVAEDRFRPATVK